MADQTRRTSEDGDSDRWASPVAEASLIDWTKASPRPRTPVKRVWKDTCCS
ncbi:hypothetical protein DYB26_007964 [Aphanomyces astaci]|uniref:Uncharacterized protein n=1 Tax=Aphanomyces astaci TaxID=112090 RepID=A0A418EFT1_APHAT|nr:hypothetical protein DYB26_007964 [Aphanomyces astaci]